MNILSSTSLRFIGLCGVVLSLSPWLSAAVLIDDNFNSGTPGANATASGATLLPSSHTTTNGVVYVGDSQLSVADLPSPNATNPFDGNAVWLYDTSATDSTRYVRQFEAQSALLVQFDVAISNTVTSGSSSDYFTLRVTNADQGGFSSTQSPFDIDIRSDGSLSVEGDTNTVFEDVVPTNGTKLSVYVNIGKSSISTTDVNGQALSIAASSFVVYAGTTSLGTWGFDSGATSFDVSEGIARMVFNSGSTVMGNIVVDNLLISSIPESSDFALVGAALPLLLCVCRRLKRRQSIL